MYNIRAVMADIYETRRERLRQLIDEQFEGNQTALARAVGFKSPYARFTDIFAGRSNLGGRTAARIEQALGLSDGWFDLKPPPGAVPRTTKGRIGPPLKVHPYNNPVRALLSAGYTQAEIARQLGVHESTVSRAVKKERRHTARTAA